jgi:hypothetical protein
VAAECGGTNRLIAIRQPPGPIGPPSPRRAAAGLLRPGRAGRAGQAQQAADRRERLSTGRGQASRRSGTANGYALAAGMLAVYSPGYS